MSNNLPTNWTTATISELIPHDGIFIDGDWVESKDQDPNGDVRLIQLADIGDGRFIDKSNRFLTSRKAKELNCTFLNKNDVLVARMPDPLGRACIFPLDKQNSFVTVVDVCAIRLNPETVDPRFLMYLINSPDSRSSIEEYKTGSTRKRISRGNLAKINLPIPPYNEQKRIVAKIEELFSELDKGIENLKTAREQLKIYRQAVLKHAFEGKLTANWREKNKDKLESANELLERIKQERDASYEQQLKEWKSAVKAWEENGNEGRKPSKPSEPVSVRHVDGKRGNSYPNVWASLPLDYLAAESVLGKMLDKNKNKGTPRPYLGNINLRWGSFDLTSLKTMRIEEDEVARYSLKNGDLVICEGGEPGRCAIWAGENSSMFIQKALHRVRFTKSYHPYFAFYFMVYAIGAGLVEHLFTGTTIKHLTGKGLGQVVFPIPSVPEQKIISTKLDEKLSSIEKLAIEIGEQLSKLEALRQSILKRAFSGKLVAQDAKDEPASVLLERIKAEKSGAKKRKSAA
ncbi:MAG: restriction endonuclease subunit S [Nitrospira sp.]|nr:restriction endonuclease subunit S [Nitrospira sp.]